MIRQYICVSCDYKFSRVIVNDADARKKVSCPLCKASEIDRVYIKRSLNIGGMESNIY